VLEFPKPEPNGSAIADDNAALSTRTRQAPGSPIGAAVMMEAVSPASYREFSADLAATILEEFRTRPGALLEALHCLQETFGYIDPAALPIAAQLFNLSRAEVHGVASFYHDFRSHKPGQYAIRVCQAEACQALGSAELTTDIKQLLGCDFHETSKDGRFTLEPVYCLGNCACPPSIMVNRQVYGRVTSTSFQTLCATLAAREAE